MGATHKAVAIRAPNQPLVIIDAPTVQPQAGEVLVHVQWTGSSPLDLHQAAGGLLVTTPDQRLGDSFAGVVAAVGSEVTTLKVGDRVTGFAHEKPQYRAQQEYVTVPTHLVSPVPAEIPLQAAATVASSLVTVFHTVTADLGLDLPWPIPRGWTPQHAETPVLLWGGAGSVGTFAVQVLRHWGYRNVLAVASAKHHDHLKSLGAAASFDYADADVTDRILAHVGEKGAGPRIPFIVDCIGLLHATVEPLTRIAEAGSRVAILLPVIVRDATETEGGVFETDPDKWHGEKWAKDVVVRGVRTHFYAENEFLRDHLQPEIIPALLEEGVVRPLRQRVVEGDTLLARATGALELLRSRAVSGERLVWRVAE